jgi:hypothetical protein
LQALRRFRDVDERQLFEYNDVTVGRVFVSRQPQCVADIDKMRQVAFAM